MVNIFWLSLIFIALVSLFGGIHIVRLNPFSAINRLFLLLSLSLSIWFFGWFLANLSQELSIALLWYRVSAIGWTTIFSFLLHYLILTTNARKNIRCNKCLYLLYIPALINIFVFSLSKSSYLLQYNLVETNYGWTNLALNNSWVYFYYLCSSIYIILSLIIVWKWKGKLIEMVKIRQVNFIFRSIVAAIVLGTVTDLVVSTFTTTTLPIFAPFFVTLPVWALFYPARDSQLENFDKISSIEDSIISDEDRKKIFNNLSLGFYTAAILAFLSEYIPYMNEEDALKLALLKLFSVASIGLLIRVILTVKEETLKENLTIALLVLSVPLCLLQFLRYGNLTVWAFPMIIMISAIIFRKLTLLVWTTIVSILTQILIWSLRPEVTVVINKYDYILRIGMFIVALLTGYYINKIYIAKIKENKDQVAFQKMVSDVSMEFVSLNLENFDEKANYLLKRIGLYFNVDRTYLFTINHETGTMTYSNEWCNVGIKEEVGTIDDIPLDVFPWWIDQLRTNNLVNIEDVDFMPEEAIAEQAQLHRQEFKSLVSVPIISEGKIQAFIGIDSILANKKWPKEKIDMLNSMSNILNSGILQKKADKQIKYMAYYDRMTKLPNRFLFENRVNHAIRNAKRTEKSITIIFLDLDGFKSVNDTLGHKGGDVLLKNVATNLRKAIRETDTVARFGGDEFMIMIDNIEDCSIVLTILDKIMSVFSAPFTVYDQEFIVTASAGIASYPADGKDPDTLVKHADIAMYQAKERGKAQYVFYSQAMKDDY